MKLPAHIKAVTLKAYQAVFGTRSALIVFLMTFFAFSYFLHRFGGWNVNSRLALTYAIVEKGSFQIDDYVDHPHYATLDRAFYDGHYYSDKSIGLSLLATPVYWVMWQAGELVGKDPKPVLSRYVLTVCLVSLSSALLMVVLMRFLLLLGQRRGIAITVVLLFAFGTMLFPFSSLFYPYLPSLFFLITAWYLMVKWRREGIIDDTPAWLLGILVGLSLLCEYTITVPACFISVYYLCNLQRRSRFLIYALGIAAPLSIFALYNRACFDSLFVLPYSYLESPEFKQGMSRGVMGIHRFQWYVLYLITIHPYRGLFVYSPFLILSFAGMACAFRRNGRKDRSIALIVVATVVYYFILNASYYMWWGGGILLTRHLIPMLPFMAITFAWFPRRLKPLLIGLGVISVVLIGTQSVVEPHFEEFYSNEELYTPWETVKRTGLGLESPYLRHSVREFLRGRISINPFNHEIYATDGKWWSLAPLLFVEAALLFRLRRSIISAETIGVDSE